MFPYSYYTQIYTYKLHNSIKTQIYLLKIFMFLNSESQLQYVKKSKNVKDFYFVQLLLNTKHASLLAFSNKKIIIYLYKINVVSFFSWGWFRWNQRYFYLLRKIIRRQSVWDTLQGTKSSNYDTLTWHYVTCSCRLKTLAFTSDS